MGCPPAATAAFPSGLAQGSFRAAPEVLREGGGRLVTVATGRFFAMAEPQAAPVRGSRQSSGPAGRQCPSGAPGGGLRAGRGGEGRPGGRGEAGGGRERELLLRVSF